MISLTFTAGSVCLCGVCSTLWCECACCGDCVACTVVCVACVCAVRVRG